VLSSQAGNNLFYVNYEGISQFNCTILNRWGNIIYEYSDPAGHWDGKTAGGELVEEGTYFYRIDAVLDGGQELQKHGFVVVKY
jgi:gliding motility-associated-like protein